MSLRPLDLSSLRRIAPTDALVYGFSFDAARGALTLFLEIDPEFHKEAAKELGLEGAGELIVDLVLEGVRNLSLDRAFAPRVDLLPGEPPHDYELATWEAKEGLVGGSKTLELRFHSGPRFAVEFETAYAIRSERVPGKRHDYSSKLGPGVRIEPPG